MSKPQRERIAEALVKMGERRVPGRSSKYMTFTRAQGGFYFVGWAGALRFGAASSRSIPVSEAFRKAILAPTEGRAS
jgi:hypothetical protein